MADYTQYMQLVQLWLMMYGKAGLFYFDAEWDDSRENQPIGVGDGLSYVFTAHRTWGDPPFFADVGGINEIFHVAVGGTTVSPANYTFIRNRLIFIDSKGIAHPPAPGEVITMTFSFYYLCHFTENEQDFEEFMENRWTVQNLKFQSVIWP